MDFFCHAHGFHRQLGHARALGQRAIKVGVTILLLDCGMRWGSRRSQAPPRPWYFFYGEGEEVVPQSKHDLGRDTNRNTPYRPGR